MTNNTITARIARYIALPVFSAGIIGGAALGLAGMASAAAQIDPSGPDNKFAPSVTAHPAPEALPGWQNHHGPAKIENRTPGYLR